MTRQEQTPLTHVFAEEGLETEDTYDEFVHQLRTDALAYAQQQSAPAWLMQELGSRQYLDGLVSSLRHLPGAQEWFLRKVEQLKPGMQWYRGGTLTQAQENYPGQSTFLSEEDRETYIIDHGANGVLARPNLAVGFLRITQREQPVLYTLSVSSLIEGLSQKVILLVSEHDYDLRVLPQTDKLPEFLAFCRANLQITDAREYLEELKQH